MVSRERLLEDVWGYDPFEQTNTIDVFISNVRRKLEAGGEPRMLHTKRGAGYVLQGRMKGIKAGIPRVPLPRAFERIPVRWRIAITTAGLTLAILVLFALVLGKMVGDRVKADFEDELRNAAGALATETRVGGPAGERRARHLQPEARRLRDGRRRDHQRRRRRRQRDRLDRGPRSPPGRARRPRSPTAAT